MKLHLKLFLCFMILLGKAEGEDPLLHEDETPGSHQEPETLITPERVHKDQVPADGGGKVSDHAIPTDDKIGKTAKPTVEKKIYVDEKCCNLSTTSHCLKKGGDCIPNNETCYGKEYFGSKYCVISDIKSCKCCVPTDCEEATLEPCKLLNGICKGEHEDCDDGDSSVSGAEFCKHKSCKCCYPTNCTCGQEYSGGCTGHIYTSFDDPIELFGHCMKACESPNFQLDGNSCSKTGAPYCKCCASLDCPIDYCVGEHEDKLYKGICRRQSSCLSMEVQTQMCRGSNCVCCINDTMSCDPPTCNYYGVSGTCSHDDITGMVNVGEQDCEDCVCYVPDGEELFGCNRTNKLAECHSETGLGITFLELGNESFYIHETMVSWFIAKEICEFEGMTLAEPQDVLGLHQYFIDNNIIDHYWLGGRGNYVSMNWLSSGAEVFPMPLDPPVWQAGQPESITSSDCLDLRIEQTPGPLASSWCEGEHYFICECGQQKTDIDCSQTNTEVIGWEAGTLSTSSVSFTNGMTIGIHFTAEAGVHGVIVILEADGFPNGVLKLELLESTCSDIQGCNWSFLYWNHDYLPNGPWDGHWLIPQCIPKNEWLLLTITDRHDDRIVYGALHGYYTLDTPTFMPLEGVTIRVESAGDHRRSEISLGCSA